MRRPLFIAVLWAWLALEASTVLAAPKPATRPPNILLIISDDQAWTDYGFMRHPHIRTPRLDRLASESLCFTRGYVPSSLCCPSLASIITGRYPHQHRVVSNDPPRPAGMSPADFYRSDAFLAGRERMASFLDAVPTLPRMLQTRGYVSFQSGKWWQNHFSRGGFTHGMTQGGRHGDAGLEIGRGTMQPIYDFMDTAERDGKPWFVWYAPMLPHDPHTPPERLLTKYRSLTNSLPVARYWAMVEWFDETCGQLLDFLDQRGLATNTVVAYVTDNGWITDPQTGRFAPRSKQSPYDGGLRTPVLVRWPGQTRPHRDDAHAVSSLDLMPTLLRVAGLKPPADLPGLDLLDQHAVRTRKTVFGECFTHDAVDLDLPERGLRWRWVVDGNWKLILPAPWNEPAAKPELYRLDRDPLELNNLAAGEPRRVSRLLRMADQWWDPATPPKGAR
jgi:arylsulfatase A-like enzyme